MTRNDDNRSDFSTLDAGKLLPGCSIPIAGSESDDAAPVHAFRDFRPLPIDGLSRSASACLADSMVDVTRSLKCLHEMDCCYGRITSMSFHNRGSVAAPQATLWIDPGKASQADAVHRGDPESMYWTEERLQTAASAKPADDWYALGMVLAEITLSSAAVHKIWELSRQDGKFVESLIKNLKRARADRRLKTMAMSLIRQGATGTVQDATISKVTTRRPTHNHLVVIVLFALTLLALIGVAASLYQRSAERAAQERQLTQLQSLNETLESRIEELEAEDALVPVPPTLATLPDPPAAKSADRERWTSNVAGRSLEQAIAASEQSQPGQWRNTLIALQSTPGQKQWRVKDQKLRRMIQMVVDTPWEISRADDAIDRLAALNEAHSRWSTWARSSRSIDEIKTQHDLMPSGLEKEFLGQWLAEALDVRSFDVQTRIVKAGAENAFVAHVIGFETRADSESLSWAWKSTEGSDESIEMQVEDYRAGDGFAFWLRQDSSVPFWDSTVIEHTFESPLLAWQFAKGLKLEDSESGYAVVLTTNTRFGPPARLEAGEASTPATPATPAAAQRKVVDPMDELPFGLE